MPDVLAGLELGVGTWQWGDRRIWQYGRAYGEADARGAFQAAVESGLSLFDTAELYGGGLSERLLGRFLRESGASALVATKFMPFPWRLGRDALRRSLQASLDRLGMHDVALYQVHWPLPLVPVEHWAEQLADSVRSGLTAAVGVSNYNVDQMRRTHAVLARQGLRLASNQVEYSLVQRGPERNGLLRACRELDVRLIAYSPLGKGLLGGRYTRPSRMPLARRMSLPPGARRRGPRLVEQLRAIGTAHGGKTPAQVALNWVICKGALPIPGARSAAQVRENAGALGWRLTPEQIAALDRLSG